MRRRGGRQKNAERLASRFLFRIPLRDPAPRNAGRFLAYLGYAEAFGRAAVERSCQTTLRRQPRARCATSLRGAQRADFWDFGAF